MSVEPSSYFFKFNFTNSLSSKKNYHEKHAAVLLGLQKIKIHQRPLPVVTKVYLQLHEKQLARTDETRAAAELIDM